MCNFIACHDACRQGPNAGPFPKQKRRQFPGGASRTSLGADFGYDPGGFVRGGHEGGSAGAGRANSRAGSIVA